MANKRYTRRDCLKILGLLTAASTFSIVSVEPVFSREFDKLKKVSRTLPLMSTYVTITIYDQSKERAVKAQEMAFSKMKKLIDIFDRFNPNSHISYLNENKTLNDVPPEFSDLLKKNPSQLPSSVQKNLTSLFCLYWKQLKKNSGFTENSRNLRRLERSYPMLDGKIYTSHPKKLPCPKRQRLPWTALQKDISWIKQQKSFQNME